MLPLNMDQWAAHRACVQQRDNAPYPDVIDPNLK